MSQVCEVLDVSRPAFYAWQRGDATVHEKQDQRLMPLIRVIFRKHRRRYGARRIAAELRDQGVACSPRRVSKLLKIQGLTAIQPKSFQPKTTNSQHRLGYSPNLLMDAETPKGINEVWVGDITYVRLRGGLFAYLALLMDRYSRRLVGWHLGEDMTERLVVTALRAAIRGRAVPPGLIHHTDRGGQYAGGQYRGMLRRAGIRQSMSRADNCYDNAFMESCFGTLKTELEMTEYEHYQAAKHEVQQYIRYYNFDRKHSALGYVTPEQF